MTVYSVTTLQQNLYIYNVQLQFSGHKLKQEKTKTKCSFGLFTPLFIFENSKYLS